jgi:hypothetical protein
MIRIKIDVTKLDKTAFFQGKNGALYCDLTMWENRDGPDRFGNDYRIDQDLGKERRAKGEKGAIIGNGKSYTNGTPGSTGGRPQQAQDDDVRYESKPIPSGNKSAANTDDSIPF